MPAGRPPKPTVLKLLAGNPGKRKINKDEPKFTLLADVANPFIDANDTDAEKPLSTEAEHWNRLAPEFLRLGLLNQVNRETLIHICQVVRDIRIYEQKIAEEGHFVDYPMFSKATGEQTGTIERENNAMRPLRDARLLHEKLLNEFGGNPSSASKVAAQKKPEKSPSGNPFAFSFAGKKASNG